MNIDVLYRSPWRSWQSRLVERLTQNGHAVRAVRDTTPSKIPRALRLALRFQQLLFGPRHSLFDVADLPLNGEERKPDLVVALDGASSKRDDILEIFFAGRSGEEALLAAIAGGCAVPIELRQGRKVVTAALLATEHPDVLSRGIDQVLARLITLLSQGVERMTHASSLQIDVSAPSPLPRAPLSALLRGTARKLMARFARERRRANHWRIAYRITNGPGLADALEWPKPALHVLAGSLDRFYADPIPVEIDGRRWIFVEDYPYDTQKGVIAVMEVLPDGNVNETRTVLQEDVHLSYPLIIRHEDAIYMLPEMSGARRVQLFRADPFPDRWIPDHILIENVIASDATPIYHEGRWWMFATLADDGGSTWDALCLFHAPDLFGPWTPHAGNPVLVDAGAARPAGPMWHQRGALMRIVQDCREGYGRGLAVCRVDLLDEETYAQTVVARLGPPYLPGADGVHTLARDGSLEVVDIRFTRCESLHPAQGRG